MSIDPTATVSPIGALVYACKQCGLFIIAAHLHVYLFPPSACSYMQDALHVNMTALAVKITGCSLSSVG